jgi:hypothetical protein
LDIMGVMQGLNYVFEVKGEREKEKGGDLE